MLSPSMASRLTKSTPIPTPPVHAARLSALLKTLANAEGAVAESIKARKALVEGLEKILSKNKEELVKEESQLQDINSKKSNVEALKREIEDRILRGIAAHDLNGGSELEPERPDAEPLTPPMPPVESITPVGTPKGFTTTTGADVIEEQPNNFAEPEPPAIEQLPESALVLGDDTGGAGFGEVPRQRDISNGAFDEPMVKRRKVSSAPVDDFAEFADDGLGIDADVEAMLGQ